jgi:hypothetical protein
MVRFFVCAAPILPRISVEVYGLGRTRGLKDDERAQYSRWAIPYRGRSSPIFPAHTPLTSVPAFYTPLAEVTPQPFQIN